MPDDTTDPFWAPSVSVVGLGDAGAETVERITTETTAELTAVDDPDEASAASLDADFCYLTGDVGEPGVVETAATILDAVSGHTSFVAEGTTERPEPIVEGSDFLLPVDPDAGPALDGRALVASAIADCFEAMLPPTARELGHGDVSYTTASGRIGALWVAALGGLRHSLSDRVDIDSPDQMLYFLCTDEAFSRTFVGKREMAVFEKFPDAGVLRDQRVHARYGDPDHVKMIPTVDADDDRWERLLRP